MAVRQGDLKLPHIAAMTATRFLVWFSLSILDDNLHNFPKDFTILQPGPLLGRCYFQSGSRSRFCNYFESSFLSVVIGTAAGFTSRCSNKRNRSCFRSPPH